MFRLHNKRATEAGKMAVLFAILLRCGSEVDFAAQQPSQWSAVETPAEPAAEPIIQQKDELDAEAATGRLLDIQLDLSCPSSGTETDETQNEEILTGGLGHTEIDLRLFQKITFSASGQLCHFPAAKRDVAIIVDVSASMATDPLLNGTCHRHQAIRQIMQKLWSTKTNRVALLTFNSRAVGKSFDPASGDGGFFLAASELEAQLGQSLADVLCHARSGTNYVAPFVWADQLFSQQSRSGVELEIYFVSDGEPELVDFGDGVLVDYYDSKKAVAIADNMKSFGYEMAGQIRTVRISTLMIGGENQILPIISSKMRGGDPYYLNLADFSQLETRLLNMVTPTFSDLELSYRSNTMKQWLPLESTLDLNRHEFQSRQSPILQQGGELKNISLKLRQTYAYGPERRLFASVGEESTMAMENQAAKWHKVPGSLPLEGILPDSGEYFDFSPENVYQNAIHHEVDFKLEKIEGVEEPKIVLGSIEPGEWLQYPIEVESTGTYNLIVEIENTNLTHKSALHFSVNGQILISSDGQSSMIVPPRIHPHPARPGASYTAVRLSDVRLSAGKQLLQVNFDTGGYALGTLSITK